MKIETNVRRAFYLLSFASLLFASCQKTDSLETTNAETSNTIAVAASASVAAAGDSVYLVQPCGGGGRRDSITQSALPLAVATYLTANYSGYTFSKAFALKNSSSLVTGYVVVIYYNDNPVGVQFDAAGTFVKVLEQREGRDINGPGHHRGGRFEHRDGRQRDTIALTTLPAAITSHFTVNYAGDTLVKAFRSRDSSVVVISKNNGVFATVFAASGSFVKREQLQSRQGACQPIELSALPSIATNYLSATYPNYVFKTAFAITQAATVKGYVVLIEANSTKYAVEFDATGNFVRSKTVH